MRPPGETDQVRAPGGRRRPRVGRFCSLSRHNAPGDGDCGAGAAARLDEAKVAREKLFERMTERGLSDKLLGQLAQVTALNAQVFGCEVRPLSAKELRSRDVFWNRVARGTRR